MSCYYGNNNVLERAHSYDQLERAARLYENNAHPLTEQTREATLMLWCNLCINEGLWRTTRSFDRCVFIMILALGEDQPRTCSPCHLWNALYILPEIDRLRQREHVVPGPSSSSACLNASQLWKAEEFILFPLLLSALLWKQQLSRSQACRELTRAFADNNGLPVSGGNVVN